MPIDFFEAPDGIHVRQSFDSPTVYLDHWAMRLFSDDPYLQNRLVNVLMSKGGTLLLSHLSFIEFTQAEDISHCHDAEKFIERLLPNIFFTDFALDKVLEQELAKPNNSGRLWPSADLPQLKFFAEHAQETPRGFTMHGLFTMAHLHQAEFTKLISSLARTFHEKFDAARGDPNYVRKAKNIPPCDNRPRTMIILGELMRGFTLDSTATISENDVVDLLHAAMSVNCCDYVLLDGPWVERINKMKQRIAKSGVNMPIAKCFSKRNNGVDTFLDDIEAFETESTGSD